MERARWWQARLELSEGEFQAIAEEFPQLNTTGGAGYYKDGPCIVIFLTGDHLDLHDLIDVWLHEYLEVEFFEEVIDHEAFAHTVTRIAQYVSSF